MPSTRASGDSSELALDDSTQRGDVIGPRVERRDVAVAFAARREEGVAILHPDLLERLEAIRREAGTHHLHVVDAATRELRERLDRVRLQPARAAEARLERQGPRVRRQFELLREQRSRPFALQPIRIATFHELLGNAVERHHEVRTLAVFATTVADAR